MAVEELVKEENEKIGEEKIGWVRREWEDVKLIFKCAAGYRPTEEEIKRNRSTWEYKLFNKHPIPSAILLLGLMSVPVSGFVYTLVNVAEYIKNLYAN